MQPVARFEVGNALGECVLWDERSGAAFWTDIDGRTLYGLDWHSRTLTRMPLGERLCAFGFIEGRKDFVGAFESGFALLDPRTGACGPRLRPEGLAAGMRMNDGRVDRQGRFWCGAMVMDKAAPAEACLYSLSRSGMHSHVKELGIANAIAWSPDSRIMYLADSRRRTIWSYAFDSLRGQLGERREFARIDEPGEPDGAVIDHHGYLWNAIWGAGRIVRYAPDGRIDRVLEVPVKQPSCVCFGGPDLEHLFVTSARLGGLPAGEGDLLVYDIKIKGLPESRFKIDNWPSQEDSPWPATMA